MDIAVVDRAFIDLIRRRSIHRRLGTTSQHIRNLRYKIRKNAPISTDLKLILLKKNGWTQADKNYDRHDLISLAQDILKASPAAREFGPEYLVEKWENKNCTHG